MSSRPAIKASGRSGIWWNRKNQYSRATFVFISRATMRVGTLSMTTRRSTTSGWSLAKRVATRAPRSCPTSATRPTPSVFKTLDDIVGHCPLVVTFRRLVGLAVSAQVRSYHPVMRGKRWNLETPGEARLREAVQEDHWGAGPGFQVELADAVCPARGSTNGGHRSRASAPVDRPHTHLGSDIASSANTDCPPPTTASKVVATI